MNNVSIIIPIVDAKLNEKLILNAIRSIDDRIDKNNILIVFGENEYDDVKSIVDNNKITCKLIKNSGNTDFCSQVNFAVDNCGTEFFSILEIDDEFSKIWYDNYEKYINFKPDVDIFLNISELKDFNSKESVSLLNEIIWANSFSNEIGVVDFDCLNNYYDFNVNGGVIRTEEFKNIGGLKSSIKLFFWYEFLLRATSKGFKCFVIPKICYYHYCNRENSIMYQYEHNMSEEEAQSWLNLAKAEYSFKEDRHKTPMVKKDEIKELK